MVAPTTPTPSTGHHNRTEADDRRHRNWVVIGILAGLILVSAVTLGFAWRSDDSSTDAELAARAAQTAAEAVQQSNADAACRAVWNAPVVDARSELDDAIAQQYSLDVSLDILQGEAEEALGDGLVAGLLDNDEASVADAVQRRDDALEVIDIIIVAISDVQGDIEVYRKDYRTANDAYQALIEAQREDRRQFDRMCKTGPA